MLQNPRITEYGWHVSHAKTPLPKQAPTWPLTRLRLSSYLTNRGKLNRVIVHLVFFLTDYSLNPCAVKFLIVSECFASMLMSLESSWDGWTRPDDVISFLFFFSNMRGAPNKCNSLYCMYIYALRNLVNWSFVEQWRKWTVISSVIIKFTQVGTSQMQVIQTNHC